MRQKLRDHVGEYVLCRGWIGGWEDLPDCATRRVLIKQPTIKQADKNLLYNDQETISTEHHLNLFVKHQDLGDYNATFEINQLIQFSGFVEQYIRTDGTSDFGIYATLQSTIEFRLEQFIHSTRETLSRPPEDVDLIFLEQASQRIMLLEEEVDGAGEWLPTFCKTYQQYKDLLRALSAVIHRYVQRIQAIRLSRMHRRSKKKRFNRLQIAASINAPYKGASKQAKDLMARLGDL